MRVTEQFKQILLPQVIDSLTSIVPVLLQIGAVIVGLCIVLVLTYLVVVFICPELHDIVSGTVGAMWDIRKSEFMERFKESPVSVGYAAYKERSGVHDGADYYIESRSLGPQEYMENAGDFSGYDWSEMNIVPADNVDLEDRSDY